MSHFERIVLLVDMDCFYCQVEENLNPAIKGKPIAVVQYNAWRGGGIIAVNYPARDRGVTRHMRGDEAKAKCPEIELVKVPNVRGKADLTKYREAGKRVAEVLQTFTTLLERASVDEAYLDITEVVNSKLSEKIKPENLKTTHVVGYETVEDFCDELFNDNLCDENNKKLAIGAKIAEEVRAAVFERTGYRCSAGVAHNKILSKLVCGLHKPNQQTVLPQQNIAILYENLPVRKIKSLGGKFGSQLAEKLNIQNMGELYRFTEKELAKYFDDKTANWLYKIARGIDLEPVTTRLVSKSIGCCKKFPGRNALVNPIDIKHWLGELCLEISERLEKDKEENNRKAKQMVVSFIQYADGRETSSSRTHPLASYDTEKIAADAFEVLRKNCTGNFCLKFLGINVSKFEDIKNFTNLSTLFKNMISNKTINKQSDEKETNRYTDHIIDSKINVNTSALCETQISSTSNNIDLQKEPNETKIGDLSDEDSNDSITQEINNKNGLTSASSFFRNYMESNQTEVNRNFDTSLSLCENIDDGEDKDVIDTEINNEEFNIDSEETSTKNICPECNKNIPIEEFTSHMDYHVAINLVKSEADMYKSNKTEATNNKTVIKPKKSVKRKISDDNCTTLTAFLKKEVIGDDVATETCDQCGKKIRIEDIPDHTDYHLAKKIHQELNSNILTSTNVKKDIKCDKNRTNSIAKFFNKL